MEKKTSGFLGLSFWLVVMSLVFSGTVSASEVTDKVKNTIDEVISIVTNETLKGKVGIRRDKLRHAIGKGFNYRQMAMRSLAREWKKRTPKEQTDFVELYKKFLEFTFASKIETFSGETINYTGEKVIKNKYALVNTEVARKEGTVKIDYKLINEKGNWLVYDFVVKGVSMIRNSRSQFEKIIRNESYASLVKTLSEKVKKNETKNSASSS